jgi:hypothetical protein
MSRHQTWLFALAIPAVLCLLAPAPAADKKEVKPIKEWKGSVEDQKLRKEAPECITSAKELKKVWEAWKVEGKVPDVDFTKEIVVVQTTTGSRLNLAGGKLDDKGNLEVLAIATLDERPGFRYVIATFPREGVKTVNGKELPKE